MTTSLRTVFACTAMLLGSLASATPAALPSAASPSASSPSASAPQDPKAEFKKKFDQAQQVNSKRQMEKLMRDYPQESVELIIDTAEAIAGKPNETVFKRMNSLRGTWKTVHNTEFCEKMEVYFSLLDGPRKRERNKLKVAYLKHVKRFFDETTKGGNNQGLGLLGTEFKAVAEQFDAVGDKYHSSQSWLFAGACNDEGYRGKDADLGKAELFYRTGLEARASVGLKDRTYKENEARRLTLQGLGFGPQPERPAAVVKTGEEGEEEEAAGPAVPLEPVLAELSFEPVPTVDTYSRPNYFLDAHYQIWGVVGLGPVDTKAPIGRLADFDLRAIRHSSAKVGLDEDGDGEPDTNVPLRGKYTLVETQVGQGEELRKTAFLAVVGLETDFYQTTQINLQPTDGVLNIYTAPAGSMVGEIGGTPVRVIDEDMDGVYGGVAKTWAHVGLSEGVFQPEIDSLVIGKSKRAQPWSEMVQVDGNWYKLESQSAGTRILATPQGNIPTGFLKLGGKGLKPDFLIVQGSNAGANTFFDLAGSKGKPVEVPTGVYKLYFGMVSKGKKRQLMKALILPGDTGTYQVSEGVTIDVVLGSPYGFDFKPEVSDGKVTVPGTSVVITGVSGERYERAYNCVPRPAVSYRKAGSKRGSKGEEMDIMLSQDDLYNPAFGFKAAWFPYDISLDLKGGATEPEVQLVEKKNKLFGKIESAWKQ